MTNPESGYPIYADSQKGAHNLLLNVEAEEQAVGFRSGVIPPSRGPKYRREGFSWDHPKHEIVLARHGTPDSLELAETEMITIYQGQFDSGQVPNQRRLYGRAGVEAIITGSKEHNIYGQPPIRAIAALEMHVAKERISPESALKFSRSIIGNLAKEALYWPIKRKNGDKDFRVGIIASEESGMDELPIYDHQLPARFKRLLRDGERTPLRVDLANPLRHYAGRLLLDRRRHNLRDTDEDLKKAKEIFWVMPVQIQALVTANLYALSKLSQKIGQDHDTTTMFAKFGEDLETQVLNDINDPDSPGMWDGSARDGKGMFRDLDRHGRPIVAEDMHGNITEETVISNLMALMFSKIKEYQLVSVVDMALDEFMHEYGLATVGKFSPNFDPKHREKETGRWRTQVWGDNAWFIAESLLFQMHRDDISIYAKDKCRQLFNQLCETSLKALDKWENEKTPIPEYSNPRTGQAYRLYRVQWFAWNNLGYVMPPDLTLSVFAEAMLEQTSYSQEDAEPQAA